MKDNHTSHHWNVSIWLANTSRLPVETNDFRDEETANLFARQQRARIAARGWTHTVKVTPVFVQE